MEIFEKWDVKDSESYYDEVKGKFVKTYAKFKTQNQTYYLARLVEYVAEKGGEIKRIGEWYRIPQNEFNE